MEELERYARDAALLHRHVMGGKGIAVRTLQDLEKYAALGTGSMVLTLRWGSGIHQLVLQKLGRDSLFFYNSAGDRSLPPGTTQGGYDGTPEREIVSPGVERLSRVLIKELFDRGEALAYYSQ